MITASIIAWTALFDIARVFCFIALAIRVIFCVE